MLLHTRDVVKIFGRIDDMDGPEELLVCPNCFEQLGEMVEMFAENLTMGPSDYFLLGLASGILAERDRQTRN